MILTGYLEAPVVGVFWTEEYWRVGFKSRRL
jgi:hypothetical protein